MAIINAGPAERRNDLNLYLTASFFALLHMVILSAKCHANQCETFRRATPRNLQTYTEQASTEELHTDLNNMQNTGVYSIQQMFLQF